MTEITQADRDAAARIVGAFGIDGEEIIKAGWADGDDIVKAFARHRLEERAAIVEWLRKVGGSGPEILADMIGAGGHLE
jgi:hypothetical protein